MRLGRRSRVPREQQPRGAVGQEEHDDSSLMSVWCRPRRVGDSARRPSRHPGSNARPGAPDATRRHRLDGAEESKIARIGHGCPGSGQRPDSNASTRRATRRMIEMGVRGHDRHQPRSTCLRARTAPRHGAGISLWSRGRHRSGATAPPDCATRSRHPGRRQGTYGKTMTV